MALAMVAECRPVNRILKELLSGAGCEIYIRRRRPLPMVGSGLGPSPPTAPHPDATSTPYNCVDVCFSGGGICECVVLPPDNKGSHRILSPLLGCA